MTTSSRFRFGTKTECLTQSAHGSQKARPGYIATALTDKTYSPSGIAGAMRRPETVRARVKVVLSLGERIGRNV